MKFAKEKSLFYWFNYTVTLLLLAVFAFHGYSVAGESLFSWLVWSDSYHNSGKIVCLFALPIVALSAFFMPARIVMTRIFELIFFVTLVKLLLLVSLDSIEINNPPSFGNFEYSVLAVGFISWILLYNADSRLKESTYLLFIGLVSAVVCFQLVGFITSSMA